MKPKLVVAIDGPAGVGKSTVAKRVAGAIDATLLDTGALYRSVAYLAGEQGVAFDDAEKLAEIAASMEIRFQWDGARNHVFLNNQDVSDAIRAPEVSRGASQVSSIPQVRAALLALQQDYAKRASVVAEGRDIGTVVFPDAQVKVFLTADDTVRAERRYLELKSQGVEVSQAEVLQDQVERDAADAGRDVAPMRAADDATTIDTAGLSLDQVVDKVLALVALHLHQTLE